MLTIACFGDLWVNKVSAGFLQQLDLKNKNKTWVQLYRFGINGLRFVVLWCISKSYFRVNMIIYMNKNLNIEYEIDFGFEFKFLILIVPFKESSFNLRVSLNLRLNFDFEY